MDWDEQTLKKLGRIFSEKSWLVIKPVLDSSGENEAQRAWSDYIMGLGLKIELSCNRDYDPKAPRFVPDAPGGPTVRLVNTWGDRYIDMPEEFAARTLALGFLP